MFDLDGTLVDSDDLHAQAWVEAFAEFDITIAHADVPGQIGKGGNNLMPLPLDQKVVDQNAEAISEARGRIYENSYASRVEPFVHVADLFRKARRDGWTIVIATSGRSEEVEPVLFDGLVAP